MYRIRPRPEAVDGLIERLLPLAKRRKTVKVSDAMVERAAIAAAKANSSVSQEYGGDLLWSYLDARAKAHWLRVARAALEAAADPLLAQPKET